MVPVQRPDGFRSVVRRAWWIGPIAFGVCAADDDSLSVPAEVRADVGRTVAKRESAAPAVRFIRLGTVQEQVAVQRDFTRAKRVVNRVAVLFGVVAAFDER